MAHFFILPPPGQYGRENKRQRRPSHVEEMFGSRSTSVSSNNSTNTTPASSPISVTAARNNSALAAHRNPSIFSTRSVPGSTAVTLHPHAPPSDDDIIIVTVKLTNSFRRSSLAGAEELPERPPQRSFWRRLTTRVNENWDHAKEREQRYKAVKMPRGEYKKYFRRDREGKYVGTEQEREWDEEMVEREFGRWQDLPLQTVAC